MSSRWTSIFGTIAGLCAMFGQSGINFRIKGVDVMGIVGAASIAGLGIVSKDWRVSGGTISQKTGEQLPASTVAAQK